MKLLTHTLQWGIHRAEVGNLHLAEVFLIYKEIGFSSRRGIRSLNAPAGKLLFIFFFSLIAFIFGLFLVIVLSALSTALVSLVCTQIQLLGSTGPVTPRASAGPTHVLIGICGGNKPNPEAAMPSGDMPFSC